MSLKRVLEDVAVNLAIGFIDRSVQRPENQRDRDPIVESARILGSHFADAVMAELVADHSVIAPRRTAQRSFGADEIYVSSNAPTCRENAWNQKTQLTPELLRVLNQHNQLLYLSDRG